MGKVFLEQRIGRGRVQMHGVFPRVFDQIGELDGRIEERPRGDRHGFVQLMVVVVVVVERESGTWRVRFEERADAERLRVLRRRHRRRRFHGNHRLRHRWLRLWLRRLRWRRRRRWQRRRASALGDVDVRRSRRLQTVFHVQFGRGGRSGRRASQRRPYLGHGGRVHRAPDFHFPFVFGATVASTAVRFVQAFGNVVVVVVVVVVIVVGYHCVVRRVDRVVCRTVVVEFFHQTADTKFYAICETNAKRK